MEKLQKDHHPSFSSKKDFFTLSLRIFFVCTILLIIPLFFHTLFLYRQEYKERVEELSSNLHILGESSALFVEQKIDEQLHVLNAFDGKENSFENFAKKFQIEKAFSLKMPLPKDSEEFLKRSSQKPFSIFLSHSLLYVTKTLDDQTLLVTAISAKHLLKEWEKEKSSPYPISISLLTEDGIIAASTRPSFLNQKISQEKNFLEPFQSFYKLHSFEKEIFFAVKVSIPKTDFFLLLTAPEDRISSVQIKSLFLRIFSFLFFFLFIGGILSLFLIAQIAKPLKSLTHTMKKVGRGDLTARFKKEPFGFEINLLGEIFNQTLEQWIQQQRETEREKVQKLAFLQELRIGHEIQTSLLSSQIPKIPGLDIGTGYLPAKEVGGDFYDIFFRNEDQLVIVIADTAGKGISACLYSLAVRSFFRSFSSVFPKIPEIISHVNDLFCLDTEISSVFVTAWIGIYDIPSKKLSYSSMGHFPPLLKKQNGLLKELSSQGIALGVIKPIQITEAEIFLEKGDALFLYTDGVIEAINPKNELFGISRLKEFLQKNPLTSSEQTIQDLLHEIKTFSKGMPLADDLTALLLHWR